MTVGIIHLCGEGGDSLVFEEARAHGVCPFTTPQAWISRRLVSTIWVQILSSNSFLQ